MSKRKFSLLRRRAEFNTHYTVLDIGTEFVKALIVKREEDKGIVIGASRIRQQLTDMQGGAVADIQSVIDNCDRALTEAEDMCEVVPGQAVMGIAGEQVRGFSTTMTLPRPQPQARITQADLAAALQAVQRRALKEAVRQMSHELGVAEVNVKLVHSTITSVRIDGYAVSNPIDFQGNVVDITVFNTFAPLHHIGALQTIAQELDLEVVATVAEPYALARGCNTEDIEERGAIFIDVGGGTTDVALVRNGGIEATRMFALGGRCFTKRLAGELQISMGEAERYKLSHGDGRLAARAARPRPPGAHAHRGGPRPGRRPDARGAGRRQAASRHHLPRRRRCRPPRGRRTAGPRRLGGDRCRWPTLRPCACSGPRTSSASTTAPGCWWAARTSPRWASPTMPSPSRTRPTSRSAG